jgi:uncharacterized membrane protein YdjX (TVP38/TMEM64 family)
MGIKKYLSDQKIRFCLFIALMLFFVVLGRIFRVDPVMIKDMLKGFPVWTAGIIYVISYVVVTFFVWFGPRDVFRFAGAYLFGPYASSFFVWIAEVLNAIVQFQVSRWMGKGYVEKRFSVREGALEKARRSAGFFTAFTLRLNPLVPFRFQDLAAGLTRMSLITYLSAIVIPSFIRILWLQIFLAGIGEAVFGDTKAVERYLSQHPLLALFTTIYFLAIIITSAILGIVAFIQRNKPDRNL